MCFGIKSKNFCFRFVLRSAFTIFAFEIVKNRQIMKKILIMLLMAVVSASASAKDKVVVFTTQPQMHCVNCENRVKSILQKDEGVKDIVTSVKYQTITVKYNKKKTSPEKLQSVLAESGYTARVLKKGEKITKEAHECKEMKECEEK